MHILSPHKKKFNVETGAHILYFYTNRDQYLDNLVSFILEGKDQGEAVIIAESKELYRLLLERLEPIDKDIIEYIDSFNFYGMDRDFDFHKVSKNLMKVVKRYLNENQPCRFWGHVDWIPQENVMEPLHRYECSCDVTISELGFTTVCAYDSTRVNSTILMDMMKSHEYMMTDDELQRSSLYKTPNKNNPTVFPSLSIQTGLDSEMDLYKQKLDFVHVVSHEVRNPLTVINAYAKLLAEEEMDPKRKEKLMAIQNNVVVIDNEISHIIHTEQMLRTDALWHKKLVLITPAFNEVIAMMKIKAVTQNMRLNMVNSLDGTEIVMSNLLGLKIIISNLVSNAIKYSYEGSTIDVKAEIIDEDETVLIEVHDYGVGMSEDQLGKLFIKYEKMNQEKSGQGIGLFMVKKLVNHFKGTIEVKSVLGKETIFRVQLPLQK